MDEQTNQNAVAPQEAQPQQTTAETSTSEKTAPTTPKGRGQGGDARTFNIRGRGGRGPGRGRGGRDRRGPKPDIPEQSDYEEKNLEVARVTRVTKGGKRMRFRVLSVIGNRKGRVGFGVGKGVDVASATAKAVAQARKSLITVPIVHETIPHPVRAKFSAAQILIKPAPKGSGVKAGGAVRQVIELAGVPNAVSKILGSPSKLNNVQATFKALSELRVPAKKDEKAADIKAEKKSEKAEAAQN